MFFSPKNRLKTQSIIIGLKTMLWWCIVVAYNWVHFWPCWQQCFQDIMLRVNIICTSIFEATQHVVEKAGAAEENTNRHIIWVSKCLSWYYYCYIYIIIVRAETTGLVYIIVVRAMNVHVCKTTLRAHSHSLYPML